MMFANPLRSAALAAYPVGAIYMSTNATDPGTLFGGTWERIQGRFLLGASSSHAVGSTGGAESVRLTEEQLPEVNGMIQGGVGTNGNSGTTGIGVFRLTSGVFSTELQCGHGPQSGAAYDENGAYQRVKMKFGGDQPHDNMPPYLSVYIWKRTA